MAYRIEPLTAGEYATLDWLSARGYDGGILAAAGVAEELPDGGVVLGEITEQDAWDIQQSVMDGEAFLTCCNDSGLSGKLWKFINSVV